LLQIGTLSGNPIAAAAGLKTLEILKRPGSYDQIFKTGRALMEGYADILKAAGAEARVVGDAPMFDVVFTSREVTDYRSALGDDTKMKRCNALLRERGVLKGESKYYISLAHTPDDVEHTLSAFTSSIAALH
jgi:glutamate-1-semialdehyde 2,1-aminomutase